MKTRAANTAVVLGPLEEEIERPSGHTDRTIFGFQLKVDD